MGRRLVVGSVIILALAAAGYFGRDQVATGLGTVGRTIESWSTRLRDLAAAEPETELGLRTVEGESASALVVLGQEEGSCAFGLLVADPGGPSVFLVLPQDLLVSVPGFGEFRLVDALMFGGPELAALAITNQFGIRIDAVAGIPGSSITEGLLGPVVVDLSAPMFVEESDGSLTRVLSAGRTEVAPDFVETLLTTIGAGDRFEWMQRQGSAWQAILEAVAEAPVVADRIMSLASDDGPEAADLLVTVAGDEDAILATVPVSRAESSTGVDALVPTPDQADEFLRARFGHLLIRPEGRPRVEVLNGNGRIGTTAEIASILVNGGFRVLRTDNADDFLYEDTLIVAQGDHAQNWAREILDLLGHGLLFLEVRAPSTVVDVSIIVGHDIPAGEG